MAKFVVQNPVIVLAGGTVSSAAAQCTISIEADDVETTNFGSAGWRERIGGLKGGTLDVEWHQDLAAGAIDSVVWPLLGGTAAFTVYPNGTAGGVNYSGVVLVTAWSPMDSAVGDLATVSTSWPISGAVARGTA